MWNNSCTSKAAWLSECFVPLHTFLRQKGTYGPLFGNFPTQIFVWLISSNYSQLQALITPQTVLLLPLHLCPSISWSRLCTFLIIIQLHTSSSFHLPLPPSFRGSSEFPPTSWYFCPIWSVHTSTFSCRCGVTPVPRITFSSDSTTPPINHSTIWAASNVLTNVTSVLVWVPSCYKFPFHFSPYFIFQVNDGSAGSLQEPGCLNKTLIFATNFRTEKNLVYKLDKYVVRT